MNAVSLKIRVDVSPLLSFLKLLEFACQRCQRTFNFCDLTFQIARVERNFSSATTGEMLVTFYPSDAFLDFAAKLFADDFKFETD